MAEQPTSEAFTTVGLQDQLRQTESVQESTGLLLSHAYEVMAEKAEETKDEEWLQQAMHMGIAVPQLIGCTTHLPDWQNVNPGALVERYFYNAQIAVEKVNGRSIDVFWTHKFISYALFDIATQTDQLLTLERMIGYMYSRQGNQPRELGAVVMARSATTAEATSPDA